MPSCTRAPTTASRSRRARSPSRRTTSTSSSGQTTTLFNPYDRVEVFWPLELCRSGVEASTPGLNDRLSRQKITLDYLAHVDAVLFVVAADMLGSMSELAVVERTLLPAGHGTALFIVNRINLIDADERDAVVRYGLKRLQKPDQLGRQRHLLRRR